MSASPSRKVGNLRVVPRSHPPQSPNQPTRHRHLVRPAGPNTALDIRVASVYAKWNCGRKIKTSVGRYPSRAIANVANRTQMPARILARHIIQCADAHIPLDLVEQLGVEFILFARQEYARRGRKVDDAAVA